MACRPWDHGRRTGNARHDYTLLVICDLIIPALNERSNIDPLFDELAAVREGARFFTLRRIILADNGSTDGTPDVAAARSAIIVREPQRGYGAACLKALAWIDHRDDSPDVVVFIDADLSDDPSSMAGLLEPIARGEADLVIGNRRKLALPGALNVVQRFGNGLACGLIFLTTGRRYHDLGSFRAVRWPALMQMSMRDRTWGWTVEMQMKAALLDIPAREVDVPSRRRREGRSKISGTVRGVITAGTKIIVTILVLWWRRRAVTTPQPQPIVSASRNQG